LPINGQNFNQDVKKLQIEEIFLILYFLNYYFEGHYGTFPWHLDRDLRVGAQIPEPQETFDLG